MKLVIGETEYDIWDSVNYATLGALDDLQDQSSTATFDGITDPYIRAAWVEAAELAKNGEDLRGSQKFRRALMGVVFLAKRRAGEKVTFEDVRALPYADAQIRLSEKELAVDDSPKESGAADDPEPSL